MSETAKQRAERMAAAAGGTKRERIPGDTGFTSVPAETGKRTKPVRLSVDMDPKLHYRLDIWAQGLRDELGVARVPAAAVVRSLVDRLTNVHGSDPELRDRLVQAVVEDLREALK